MQQNNTRPTIEKIEPKPTNSKTICPVKPVKTQQQTNDGHDQCFQLKIILFMMAAFIVCVMIIFCYGFKRFERENGLLSTQLKSYYKKPQNSSGYLIN